VIGWLGFAGAVGFILLVGWGFICDFDEWWNGRPGVDRVDEERADRCEPAWAVETLAEIHRLPEVVHQ
jgi:hypothetical protein